MQIDQDSIPEDRYGEGWRTVSERGVVSHACWTGSEIIDRLSGIGLTGQCFEDHKSKVLWMALEDMREANALPQGQDLWLDVVRYTQEKKHAHSESSVLDILGGYHGIAVDFLPPIHRSDWAIRMARVLIGESARHRLTTAMANASLRMKDPSQELKNIVSDLATIASEAEQAGDDKLTIAEIAADLLSGTSDSMSDWTGTWGIPSLDAVVPVMGPMLTAVCARPGAGKTTIAVQAVRRSADLGLKCAFISMEMDPKTLTARLVAAEIGCSAMDVLQGKVSHTEAGAALRAFVGCGVEIMHRPSPHYRTLCSEVEDLAKDGYQVIVIDYLQRMQGYAKQSQWEYLEQASNMFADTCRVHGINMIVLAQLTKEGASDERKGGKVVASRELQSTDMAGGQGLHKAADNVVMMWKDNPKAKGKAKVIAGVTKARFTGETEAELWFDMAKATFEDYSKQDQGPSPEKILYNRKHRGEAPDEDLFADKKSVL